MRRIRTKCNGTKTHLLNESARNDAPRVRPFVDDLVHNPRVRVLRRKRRPEEFESHTRDGFDHGRVVKVPPAAVDVQVAKLLRHNANFVLVHAGEKRGKEFDARVARAHGLERRGVLDVISSKI